MLAILGATGFTGRLVCTEARRLGIPVRLVGRRREALLELGDDVRVADARDEDAVARAFDGAAVVASCAGPFLELGHAPVAAAIRAGAHYLDTSGEIAFARIVYERHGGISNREAARLVEVIFESIKERLGDGDKVQITGFGTFLIRQKRERKGRNPQTGEEMVIKSRRSVVFRPSKLFGSASE